MTRDSTGGRERDGTGDGGQHGGHGGHGHPRGGHGTGTCDGTGGQRGTGTRDRGQGTAPGGTEAPGHVTRDTGQHRGGDSGGRGGTGAALPPPSRSVRAPCPRPCPHPPVPAPARRGRVSGPCRCGHAGPLPGGCCQPRAAETPVGASVGSGGDLACRTVPRRATRAPAAVRSPRATRAASPGPVPVAPVRDISAPRCQLRRCPRATPGWPRPRTPRPPSPPRALPRGRPARGLEAPPVQNRAQGSAGSDSRGHRHRHSDRRWVPGVGGGACALCTRVRGLVHGCPRVSVRAQSAAGTGTTTAAGALSRGTCGAASPPRWGDRRQATGAGWQRRTMGLCAARRARRLIRGTGPGPRGGGGEPRALRAPSAPPAAAGRSRGQASSHA